MYTIYVDDNTLYVPNWIDDGYSILQPKLNLEVNKAGSLTFIVPPTNPMYNSMNKLKSIITVEQDGEEIFRGRVLHDEKDFYRRKNVYCEGELSFLCDSIMRPYDYKGSIPDLFKKFIENHNIQVEKAKQFTLGNMTVVDSNGNDIIRSNEDYTQTFDELTDKLLNTRGGYIKTRLEKGVRYIDYVKEYGSKSKQTIEFGINMLDITEYISADEVFTVLIPLGADDDNGKPVNITSVNDNKDYIQNDDGVKLFGKIWRTETWDDVTIPSNLLTRGQDYLKKGIEMSVSLTMKAVDLHLLDVNTERIRLGDKVRVVSVPHGIDKYMLCSRITIDLVNPENNEYTFGTNRKSMTEKTVNALKHKTNIVR